MRTVFVIAAVLILAWSLSAQPGGAFFVPNQGQWDGDFLFRYQGPGITCFVTGMGMTLDFRKCERTPPFDSPHEVGGRLGPFPHSVGEAGRGWTRGHVLRLSFVNANPNPEVIGEEKLSSYSNYFLGRDSCRWRSFVPNYQNVIAKEVWPGIDVEYLAHADGVETLFRVKPGADVSRIVLEYEGLERPLEVDAQGNLLLHTSLGAVKEKAPWAYQIIGSRRIEVPVSFHVLSNTRYGLSLGQYDDSKELVIDPRLIYSTYFGQGFGIDRIAKQGDALIISGSVEAWAGEPINYPVTPGAYQDSVAGHTDAFVTKLSADGHQIIFSTFLGGSGEEWLGGCAPIPGGPICLGGHTASDDWPLTTDAFDTVREQNEGFVTCLSSEGDRLEFSSYIGGAGHDAVGPMVFDTLSGLIYFGGYAGPPAGTFPLTPDALYRESVGTAGFAAIYDPVLHQLAYSTLVPTTVDGASVRVGYVAPEADRRVWVSGGVSVGGLPTTENAFRPTYCGGGSDGFLALLDLQSGETEYCSYFGGSNWDACGIRAVLGNRVVLNCATTSPDLPVTPDAFDTVLAGPYETSVSILELPAHLLHSTFLGGFNGASIGVAGLDRDSNFIMAGYTSSFDFPITPGAVDSEMTDDPEWHGAEGVVCKLSADLTQLLYSTFLGGVVEDFIFGMELDGVDSIWVGGQTLSGDFPVTEDAFQHTSPAWESNFLAHIYIGPGTGSGTVGPAMLVPEELTLTCYPNPFNATAVLRFTLPRAGSARLLVYDLLGRKVLDENLGRLPAGEHQHTLDASDLPSGIYFARLEALGLERVQKMVILR